jgi:hypothetical protein
MPSFDDHQNQKLPGLKSPIKPHAKRSLAASPVKLYNINANLQPTKDKFNSKDDVHQQAIHSLNQ